MASSLMNGMCGIKPCFALSGLVNLLITFTRGVAPGWFVVAPSGRGVRGALQTRTPRLVWVALVKRDYVHGTSRSSFGFPGALRLGLRPQPRSIGFALVILVLGLVQTMFASTSPLADAVEKSDRSTIRTLLRQHADVNTPQADSMTALHWAAYKDDFETAKLLLKAGADAKATNGYGVTALSMACVNGNAELVELLLE